MERRNREVKREKKLREETEAVIRKDESQLMNEATQTAEGNSGEELIQSRDSAAETTGDTLRKIKPTATSSRAAIKSCCNQSPPQKH